MHDSIEDARTALQLYEEYCRMEAEGRWDEELEEVYSEGKRLVSHYPRDSSNYSPTAPRLKGWKVPLPSTISTPAGNSLPLPAETIQPADMALPPRRNADVPIRLPPQNNPLVPPVLPRAF